MSLILEALRKSEAQRRRAQAPGLFAEPVVAARQAPTTRPRWWAGAVASIALLVLAGWLLRGQWQAPPQPAATTSGDRPAAQREQRGVDNAAAGTDAMAGDPGMPVRSPVAEPMTDATATATATTATPTAAPPVDPPPSRVEGNQVTAAPPQAIVTPAGAARAVTPAPAPAAGAATPPTMPPVPSPTAPTVAGNTVLRLADLGSAERLQLPALKMSMHLWDAAPAQRFVIIDGERKVQGDRIGDAVVEEITPDGVVLAWQGRRLKLVLR